MTPKPRCIWCNNNSLLTQYHDDEWGVPLYDEQKLFEFIILEGIQAGLSWLIVLQRREHYRQALDDFNPQKMARYSSNKIEILLQNPLLIRNRLKMESLVKNARGFLKIQEQHGSFSDYVWQFVDGKPQDNQLRDYKLTPSVSKESGRLSAELKKQGFSFVGTTICYAFMQATGMVNDHVVDCFRHEEVGKHAKF